MNDIKKIISNPRYKSIIMLSIYVVVFGVIIIMSRGNPDPIVVEDVEPKEYIADAIYIIDDEQYNFDLTIKETVNFIDGYTPNRNLVEKISMDFINQSNFEREFVRTIIEPNNIKIDEYKQVIENKEYDLEIKYEEDNLKELTLVRDNEKLTIVIREEQ